MTDAIGPGEAAARLGVSTRTVQRWLRTGRLPAVRVGQRVKVDASAAFGDATVATKPGPSPGHIARLPPRQRPIRRLLVANRGELVVRIARTCRRLGVECLGLATHDQADAWWARQPDLHEVVPLSGTYLDGPAIVAAALAVGADAVHPGYGFLAERPDFAELVQAAGLIWVGPPPGAMRALGDKAAARRLAVASGVPVLAGYDGRGQSDALLAREARRIGYPNLIKPSAGGGGKGMHRVDRPADLRAALATARREAQAAFGDDRLVLERCLAQPRHVEIQLFADHFGTVIHLGERDCSLQRRHQKVIEEAPAPGVDPQLRDALGAAALRLAGAAGYEGAGTAEFLLAADGTFAFLELNARLQVEHPVTEVVTGLDLVELQLRVAAGEPLGLQQTDIRLDGHAIEARLYAEAPWAGFLPVEGEVLEVRWPSGAGLRIDAGVGPGDVVGLRYDPLLAKIIAAGDDRAGALERLANALAETHVVGVDTNRGFLRWLLDLPATRAGTPTTETIESNWRPEPTPAFGPEAWAAAAFALEAVRSGGSERSGLLEPHRGSGRSGALGPPGLPSLPGPPGFRLNASPKLRIQLESEAPRSVAVPARAPSDLAWTVPDRSGSGVSADAVVLDLDGRAISARLAAPPTTERALLGGSAPGTLDQAAGGASRQAAAASAALEGGEPVRAPMPGTVLSVAVEEGQAVVAHQPLLVLEAMKMENVVTAPAAGRIVLVLVAPGQAVRRDDPLILLDG